MSVSKLTLLYCDAQDCSRPDGRLTDLPFDASGVIGNAAEQRALAKREGWIKRGSKDYCDECAKKMGAVDSRSAK